MKRGFTLVELLVVMAMIALLASAMSVSVSRARTRAKVSKATQEVREMTNAILAFEQYAKNHSLEQYARGSWADCTESAMAMILGGGVKGESGEEVPVLYNGNVRGGRLLDPWGRPYQYMIEKYGGWNGTSVPQLKTAAAFPNFNRLSDKERQ